MPLISPWVRFRRQILRYMVILKLCLFLPFFTFSFVIWSQYRDQEAIKSLYNVGINESINPRLAENNTMTSRQPKDLKFILRWTGADYVPFSLWGSGQEAFIRSKCSMINCYVTSDRNFFNGDLTKFHAIAFNGRQFSLSYTKEQFPKARSPHQKYIYFNTESESNEAICSDIFDDVFNWTATYRLDSDILYNYILIKDKNGNIVGPKVNMPWVKDMDPIDEEYTNKLKNKSIAAAWFVTHCTTRSKREKFASKLEKYLTVFNRSLDIFGGCGTLKCPHLEQRCYTMLEEEYFFYLAFENSFSEDYVTEKLLTALQHDVVPIVFGGADYSRFLPRGSYLDARAYNPMTLAVLIDQILLDPERYHKFFRWKKYYTYEDASAQSLCNLCEALNNKTKFEQISVYHDFRRWWNGKRYPDDCRKNITKFDAIVFNGQAFRESKKLEIPKVRSDRQIYIFYEKQSADDCLICKEDLEKFFNLTITYRLESDIPCPYIAVQKQNNTCGPKNGMTWNINAYFRKEFNPAIKTKKKLVAWFPFNCTRLMTPSIVTFKLKEALKKYKLDVHTYGNCGGQDSVKRNKYRDKINREYFFLLIIEDPEAMDYVTDKVLLTLHSNAVPVVFGGADNNQLTYFEYKVSSNRIIHRWQQPYNRRACSYMVQVMAQRNVYKKYFTWKEHYSFQKAEPIEAICSLCEALNDKANTSQGKRYNKFQRWWNSDYLEQCFGKANSDEITVLSKTKHNISQRPLRYDDKNMVKIRRY